MAGFAELGAKVNRHCCQKTLESRLALTRGSYQGKGQAVPSWLSIKVTSQSFDAVVDLR